MPAALTQQSSTAAGDTPEANPAWSLLVWWVFSTAVLISTSTPRLLSKAVVIPDSHSLLSSPEAWRVPLSRLTSLSEFCALPWLLVAILAGIVISLIAYSAAIRCGVWTALLTATALSWGFRDVHLLSAALLLGLAWLFEFNTSKPSDWRPLIGVVALAAIALAATLEFGFVLLFCLCLVCSDLRRAVGDRATRRRIAVPGIVLLGFGMAAFHPGFRSALLRPFSCLFSGSFPGLLDELSPAISLPEFEGSQLLLLAAIGAVWFRTARSGTAFRNALACLLVFTCLGVLCSYYLWLSAVAVVLCSRPDLNTAQIGRLPGLAIAVILIGCLSLASGPGTPVREYLVRGSISARRIDPTQWGVKGPVMLLDLDRSSEWQAPGQREEFPLVLDDRWDVSGDRYPGYAALVSDLREMRAMVYLRTDLQFGGYRHQLKKWDPLLVVAESDDLEAIRILSLSPDWKLMGIDPQTTIFGQADNPVTLPQIRKAGDLLLTLEWPNKNSAVLQQNVIAASTPADLRRVSAVLVAIRLPYAALRLLPPGDSLPDQKIRVWCYLELAHRTLRETGYHSLLDGFRAATTIRRIQASGGWDAGEIDRLSRSLEGLGLGELSAELFPEADHTVEKAIRPGPRKAALSSGATEPEADLRMLILQGQTATARGKLQEFPAELSPFFATLLSSLEDSPEELSAKLYSVSENAQLPRRLRAEALDYLGCVAIEFGDREVAINSLSQSERLDPQSNWSPLRLLYLQSLQRP